MVVIINVSASAQDESITTAGASATLHIGGTTTTSSGINFDSLNSDGATAAIWVTDLSGAGSVTIEDATITNLVNTGIYLTNITTAGAFTVANIDIDGEVSGATVGISSGGGHTATLNFGTGAGGVSIDGAQRGISFSGAHSTVNLGTGAGGLQLGTTTELGSFGGILFGNSGTFLVGNAGVTSPDQRHIRFGNRQRHRLYQFRCGRDAHNQCRDLGRRRLWFGN